MSTQTCRLCHAEDLETVLSIARLPRNIQALLKRESVGQEKPIDLTVLRCRDCGFVQIRPVLDDSYYDDYLMTTTHSRQMQDYQHRQASDFVARFALAGKPVIECGCGDGSFLAHLKACGTLPSGIEPSDRFRRAAVDRGFVVTAGYLDADTRIPGGPFAAFVTRQVLEHVPDIHDFLAGIRNNLVPGAAGLVEVPSLEKALADHRFYDFFPDHVNYFSLPTLKLAMEMHGFEVLELLHGMHGEYNIAIVRFNGLDDFAPMQKAIGKLAQEMKAFIAAEHAAGGKVALWGAGGKGLSVMAAGNIDRIDLLVDADPHKQGLYTPVSRFLVEAPARIAETGITAVIVTAMAYRNEIEKSLRGELGFKGPIAFLGQHLEVQTAGK